MAAKRHSNKNADKPATTQPVQAETHDTINVRIEVKVRLPKGKTDKQIGNIVDNAARVAFSNYTRDFTSISWTPVKWADAREAAPVLDSQPYASLLSLARVDPPNTPFVSLASLEPVPSNWNGFGMAERITNWLRSVGVAATAEHPGVVALTNSATGMMWVFGDEHDNWNADIYQSPEYFEAGFAPVGEVELPVSSDNKSLGKGIAIEICAAMIWDSLTDAQRAYSALHPTHAGFSAMHDFCDANMLYPGVELYDANNEYHTDFCNAVGDAVNAIAAREVEAHLAKIATKV